MSGVLKIVDVNGVKLGTEAYGDPGMPAIVLIAGSGSSMDGWDPAFCERLAGGPAFVLRYDQRDTGQSTTDPAGAPSYTGADLVADVVGLLDEFGIGAAHLVGVSMGGAMAQLVALDHPDRVASLTLIETSSGPAGDLPPMSPDLVAYFEDTEPPDWSDRSAVIDHLIDVQRALAGSSFDEAAVRATAVHTVDRSPDMAASLTNHNLLSGGEPWRDRLPGLAVPTLVIHGTEDGVFPPGHGEALAREIPGARLMLLPGVGHEAPPPSTWDTVVPAILTLTSGVDLS
jgi:pimeloyl-ACP methyl ester carboxylesterase